MHSILINARIFAPQTQFNVDYLLKVESSVRQTSANRKVNPMISQNQRIKPKESKATRGTRLFNE